MSNTIGQCNAPYGKVQADYETSLRTVKILAEAKKREIYPARMTELRAFLLFPITATVTVAASFYRLIERIIEIGKTCFTDVDNKGGKLGYHLISLVLLDSFAIITDIACLIIALVGNIVGVFIPSFSLCVEEFVVKTDYLDKKLNLWLLKKMVPSPSAPKNPTSHALQCPQLKTFLTQERAIELWQKIEENEKAIANSRDLLIPNVSRFFESVAGRDLEILNAILSEDYTPTFEKLDLSMAKDVTFYRFLQLTAQECASFDINGLKTKLKDFLETTSNEELAKFSKTLIKVFRNRDRVFKTERYDGEYEQNAKAFIKETEQHLPIIYGIGMLIY